MYFANFGKSMMQFNIIHINCNTVLFIFKSRCPAILMFQIYIYITDFYVTLEPLTHQRLVRMLITYLRRVISLIKYQTFTVQIYGRMKHVLTILNPSFLSHQIDSTKLQNFEIVSTFQ